MDEIDRKLAEAEEAEHDFLTGKSASEFTDQNGEKIAYRSMTLSQLRLYIADLKNQKANQPKWPRPYVARF